MQTPVVFILFKRTDTTRKVFELIRRAQPPKLLVIADGPRPDRPEEAQQCAETRSIVDSVDWDCEVLKNYSDENLGCKRRISSGLDWVFQQVEEAIILEDDCVPHPDFFPFCETLLQQYRYDERVMSICGTNVRERWKSDHQSYHFSYHGSVWGWATWRRAWQHFDVNMKLWGNSEIKDRVRDILADDYQYKCRSQVFEAAFRDQIDAWSYSWRFATLIQSGLNIVPSVNLISNIGFGKDATHTKSDYSQTAYLKASPCNFPLKMSEFVAVDRDYDQAVANSIMPPRNIIAKIKRKLRYGRYKTRLLINWVNQQWSTQ